MKRTIVHHVPYGGNCSFCGVTLKYIQANSGHAHASDLEWLRSWIQGRSHPDYVMCTDTEEYLEKELFEI